MREIKFRGKLINSGNWSEGNLIIRKGNSAEILACTSPDATPIGTYGRIDVNTIGQYTGLHDKNGKEIYEGDIVKVENIDLAQIIYDEDRMAWGIKPINDFYFDSPLLADNVSLELQVIRKYL